jgi:hypothetical protein
MTKKYFKNKIECCGCGKILESIRRHDFIACRCGSEDITCFTDGGVNNGYIRRGGRSINIVEEIKPSEYEKYGISREEDS